MFLKQIYARIKQIKFPRGSYQTYSSEYLLFNTKFYSARQFKNHIELFSTILDESRLSQMKIKN